ncbi:hypothetical protein L208DRAFT_1416990 [Tricholoma matsutake]|nr:hypothetical protein L208DRAFT_1416990 [Tricholoma matsutake 945]
MSTVIERPCRLAFTPTTITLSDPTIPSPLIPNVSSLPTPHAKVLAPHLSSTIRAGATPVNTDTCASQSSNISTLTHRQRV